MPKKKQIDGFTGLSPTGRYIAWWQTTDTRWYSWGDAAVSFNKVLKWPIKYKTYVGIIDSVATPVENGSAENPNNTND